MASKQERGFTSGQFVIASIKEAGLEDELAYVDKPLDGSFYEVVFLQDHKPQSGADPIRVLHSDQMRPSTENEVLTKKEEWEEKNGHRLGLGIAKIENRIIIAELIPPKRDKL